MDIAMIAPAPEVAQAPSTAPSKQTEFTDNNQFAQVLNASLSEDSISTKGTEVNDTSDKSSDKATTSAEAMLAAMIVPNQSAFVMPNDAPVQTAMPEIEKAVVNAASIEQNVVSMETGKSSDVSIAAAQVSASVSVPTTEETSFDSNETAQQPKSANQTSTQSSAIPAKQISAEALLDDLGAKNFVAQTANVPTADAAKLADQTTKQGQNTDIESALTPVAPQVIETANLKTGQNKQVANQNAQAGDPQAASVSVSQQTTGQGASQSGANNQSSQGSFAEAIASKVTSKTETGADSKASGFESRLDGLGNQVAVKTDTAVAPSMAIAEKAAVTAAETDLPRRIIDQVVREIKLSQANGKSTIVVRMDPPELGSLQVRIMQDAQGITSQIQANNEQVRGLLQAHVATLVESLAGAGIKMDSVSVTTGSSFGSMMQNSEQGFGFGSAEQQSNNSNRQAYSGRNSASEAVAAFAGGVQGTSSNVGYSWLA